MFRSVAVRSLWRERSDVIASNLSARINLLFPQHCIMPRPTGVRRLVWLVSSVLFQVLSTLRVAECLIVRQHEWRKAARGHDRYASTLSRATSCEHSIADRGRATHEGTRAHCLEVRRASAARELSHKRLGVWRCAALRAHTKCKALSFGSIRLYGPKFTYTPYRGPQRRTVAHLRGLRV